MKKPFAEIMKLLLSDLPNFMIGNETLKGLNPSKNILKEMLKELNKSEDYKFVIEGNQFIRTPLCYI